VLFTLHPSRVLPYAVAVVTLLGVLALVRRTTVVDRLPQGGA
jgi:hypothetical protein